MPDDTALQSGVVRPARFGWLQEAWPLLLGVALLAVPTIVRLGGTVWTEESGAHGPIIIFTGIWLLSRQAPSFRTRGPGSLAITWLILLPSLGLYAFSRAFDFISLEVVGMLGVALAVLYSLFGLGPLLRNWFPLGYFAFVIPPPGWLLDQITAPLKQIVSQVSTETLSAVGIPISRQGVTIYVAQYQLLVEDACSGLNSLVGLIAISLFYIYLLRGSSLRYSALLTVFVIPIAIIGNIARIIVLILLTYFFGDEVAQGFMHQLSGVFLFAVDLLLVFALDSLLVRVVPASWKPR